MAMLSQPLEDHFIGRKQEIQIFNQWLDSTQGDTPWILYFHDSFPERNKKGGIGKTSLLNKFAALAGQYALPIAVVRIDFFDVAYRDGIAIARHIIDVLEKKFPGWSARHFSEAYREYYDPRTPRARENKYAPVELFQAMRADLNSLDRHLVEEYKMLLVFFDTFELIEQNPNVASMIAIHTFPEKYAFEHIGVVIASRNPIDWQQLNWRGREREVLEFALKPFDQQEMAEYLRTESICDIADDAEQARILCKLTEGRPILVGLVADVINQRVLTADQLTHVSAHSFESYLVTQINYLDNPVNWVILFMAHVYHRFNAAILKWILQKSELKSVRQDIPQQNIMDRLPRLSFVRKAGSGKNFVLHDEMRRLVLVNCWDIQDPDHSYRKEISQCMIDYYQDQMNGTVHEQTIQMYTVESLYHTLFLDLSNGLSHFKRHFDFAIDKSKIPFAQALWQETQHFDTQMSAEQRWEVALTEAQLLRLEENAKGALKIYENLRQQATQAWLDAHHTEILIWTGRCFILESDYPAAILTFDECLLIEEAKKNKPQIATVLGWLGFAYRSQGQLKRALEYYERSKEIYQQLGNQRSLASTLNNISFIYKLQGKTQDARRVCDIALHIRRGLFQARQISEIPVALSLSSMGQIYLDAGNFVYGEQCFREAFEIYSRNGRKRDMAATYNRFGLIAMAKTNFSEARKLFEQAAEASDDGVNTEAYINSLNKQGKLHTRQKQWAEAKPFFVKAVNKSQEVRDDYQYTENLLDLAETHFYLGEQAEAEQMLQRATQLAQQRDYGNFLGRAEDILGDIQFTLKNYQQAFAAYQHYCLRMANRNLVAYEQSITKVTARLFELPQESVPAIVDTFITYWEEQKMDAEYSALAATLQDIKYAIAMRDF